MVLMKKSRREGREGQKRRRLQGKPAEPGEGFSFDRGGLGNIALFAVLTVLIILVCFAGLSPASPLIQEGQVSRTRIIAEIGFEYESALETNRLREERGRRVPPVFRIDLGEFENFRDHLSELFEATGQHFAQLANDNAGARTRATGPAVTEFLQSASLRNPYNLNANDLALLLGELSPSRRAEVLVEGLRILEGIHLRGIYDTGESDFSDAGGGLRLFNITDATGQLEQVEIQPRDEALRMLRIQLSALDVSRGVSIALFRILREGVAPNIVFDEERTQANIAQTQAAVTPVRITVRQGDTIIEPNSRITARQVEQLDHYRRALREAQTSEIGLQSVFIERALLTIVIVIGAALYLRVSRISLAKNRRLVLFSALLILFNLGIIRLVLELGTTAMAETFPVFTALLPYLLPIALGPMIITILLGTGPGILAAAIIGVLNAMMQGSSVVVLIASHLTALVAIYHCRNIQMRARVVRAGFFSGLVMGGAALFLGPRDAVEVTTVLLQVLAGIGAGSLTGVIVVGLLPVWENLFRYTTDITLLELTDFNHPLLRRLQVEAPGSYHHSLMVANLSENAAARIGANALLCRVCALYHDIGKMVKPEYYTENQRDGYNPHIERNPSMSALVIKSHVKEGVQMARQYKLPQVIIDVIREHHGTSLIQYFYYKALERARVNPVAEPAGPNAPRIELDPVNENTYRYEGPRPHFTESAIIMLADSVEAAGRSLRKVTPQSIEELLDKIVTQRLEDGQLDDTPLTVRELAAIKDSFAFTLLNMLHSRVEYPDEGEVARAKKRAARKSSHPFAEAAARAASTATEEKADDSTTQADTPPPHNPTGREEAEESTSGSATRR